MINVEVKQKKRLTRSDALYKVLNFGIREEHNFIREGRDNDAYQIRCARNNMISILTLDTVERFKRLLHEMTEYTVDSKGYRKYVPFIFIMDEYTRELVNKFKESFGSLV